MFHIATQPSYARRGTAWLGGHELFLTQFEAGESISAIPRALRAILPTDVGVLTHRGGAYGVRKAKKR